MSIEAMKQALDALEKISMGGSPEWANDVIPALRQAIEQAENQEPDLPPVEIGVDVTEHGTTVVAFYRRPNAVMEMFYSQFHPQPKQPKNPSIRIQNHTHTEQTGRCTSCGGAPVTGRLDRTGECDCIEPLANPIANQPETSGSPMPVAKYDSIELHVLHSHLAGMLYDFMGWLTSRRTRLCLSDRDNASPAVDAIVDFAKMRGLKLEDAQVEHWQAILTTPCSTKGSADSAETFGKPEQAEKQQALDKKADNARELGLDYEPDPVAYIDHVSGKPKFINGYVVQTDYDIPLYTAPPRKKWVGLDDEDWMNVPDFQKEGCELDAAIYDWIEARLKEKNT
jgi:hypothetical protein